MLLWCHMWYQNYEITMLKIPIDMWPLCQWADYVNGSRSLSLFWMFFFINSINCFESLHRGNWHFIVKKTCEISYISATAIVWFQTSRITEYLAFIMWLYHTYYPCAKVIRKFLKPLWIWSQLWVRTPPCEEAIYKAYWREGGDLALECILHMYSSEVTI
jgi:hypothetical protein